MSGPDVQPSIGREPAAASAEDRAQVPSAAVKAEESEAAAQAQFSDSDSLEYVDYPPGHPLYQGDASAADLHHYSAAVDAALPKRSPPRRESPSHDSVPSSSRAPSPGRRQTNISPVPAASAKQVRSSARTTRRAGPFNSANLLVSFLKADRQLKATSTLRISSPGPSGNSGGGNNGTAEEKASTAALPASGAAAKRGASSPSGLSQHGLEVQESREEEQHSASAEESPFSASDRARTKLPRHKGKRAARHHDDDDEDGSSDGTDNNDEVKEKPSGRAGVKATRKPARSSGRISAAGRRGRASYAETSSAGEDEDGEEGERSTGTKRQRRSAGGRKAKAHSRLEEDDADAAEGGKIDTKSLMGMLPKRKNKARTRPASTPSEAAGSSEEEAVIPVPRPRTATARNSKGPPSKATSPPPKKRRKR